MPLWAEISFTEGIFGPQIWIKFYSQNHPEAKMGPKKTRRVPKTSSGLIFAIFFIFEIFRNFYFSRRFFEIFELWAFFFRKNRNFQIPPALRLIYEFFRDWNMFPPASAGRATLAAATGWNRWFFSTFFFLSLFYLCFFLKKWFNFVSKISIFKSIVVAVL